MNAELKALNNVIQAQSNQLTAQKNVSKAITNVAKAQKKVIKSQNKLLKIYKPVDKMKKNKKYSMANLAKIIAKVHDDKIILVCNHINCSDQEHYQYTKIIKKTKDLVKILKKERSDVVGGHNGEDFKENIKYFKKKGKIKYTAKVTGSEGKEITKITILNIDKKRYKKIKKKFIKKCKIKVAKK